MKIDKILSSINRTKDILETMIEINKKNNSIELETCILELKIENLEQAKEILALKEELAFDKLYIFQNNMYWKKLDNGELEGPYCPECYSNKNIHRLIEDSNKYKCFNCKLSFNKSTGKVRQFETD